MFRLFKPLLHKEFCLLPSITFLDLETTGATPLKDRITEIALVRFDHGVETARWQTLVNPEQPIPPFIQQLTGIDDGMVADAPVFAEVADQLLAFLNGSVLAAHNVRFDHGFLKAEFQRLNITLKQKVLCTVKLSRLLYPEHRSHGLDAIMSRHQITSVSRHRAMGDVESVLAFLTIAKQALGDTAIKKAVTQLMAGPSLPPNIDAQLLEEMPETLGVYVFYGDDHLPLFVGKAANVRSRVLAHFKRERASAKEALLNQEVKHIEWRNTAGDLGALLLESTLVKTLQPIYNRQLRNERLLFSWQLNDDTNAIPLLTLVSEAEITTQNLQQLYGTFKTKRQALEVLRKLAQLHQLCPKVLGLEQGGGTCLSSPVNRCKGVCNGTEKPELHYLRLKQALLSHQIKPWPFTGKIGIREKNVENGLTQIHLFEHWCYLGAVENDADLHEDLMQSSHFKFDLDMYKILLKVIADNKTELLTF